jgi:TRAP transporter 4TM/12TM fusion protein
LDKLGAGNFFIQLALALTGRRRGGPALTSVVASGLMGSISGSSVSNVVTTGTFTIPLMKRTGYTPLFAGAVEAVASTGGQIMPPVMGAGAFVMAELLGTSYANIAMAAAIPAVLYFASVGLMVYFEAQRRQLKVLKGDDVPSAAKTLRTGYHLLIPLAVLVYLLVVRQLSPMLAGFYATCTLVATASIFIVTREKRLPWREIIAALEQGITTAVPVAMACASAGLVNGVVSLTGLGVRFTQMVIHMSGGVLWLGGLLTMVACIILGMGLPTTAAYIITAVLGVPALTDMGVSPLQAHMFIFYFAIISFITPPVAISAYAASGIAETNAMKTGFQSFKLGLAGFIVPFLFLYSPSIVLEGSMVNIIINSLTALLGVTALAGGLVGWFFMPLPPWLRLVFLASAIALIVPNVLASVAGVAPLVIVPLLVMARRKTAAVS